MNFCDRYTIQNTQKPLARQVNTNTSAQTHHHKQTAKNESQGITLKSEKKKRVTYKRTAIRMFADFSLEIMVLKWHRNFLGAKKITYIL